jgi:3-hydroxybutyryl-CoA dehydrogenase
MNAPRHALVVGGGVMGRGIATAFAAGGWSVAVVSPSQRTRDALPGAIASGLAALRATGRAGTVAIHASLDDLDWPAVELVVETVTEDLALKRALFAQLVARARPEVPLASNTSSFPVSALAADLATPSRILGLHFFMPAHLSPLVEIVHGPHTDAALAARVGEWMRALGKRPVQVRKEIVGFLGNRMQAALMREALWLVDQGIATPEDVDAAVRYGFGFRYAVAGPLLQKEHSGWDTTHAVAKIIYPTLCNAAEPSPVLRDMVAEHRIGMKSGRGFYEWTPEAMARERARYERAMSRVLAVLRDEEEEEGGAGG